MANRRRWGLAVGLATVVAAACGDGGDGTVDQPSAEDGLRLASFDFAESILLAELYAQTVESTGTPVVRMGSIGPREIVMPAIQRGLVDVVPEYLGTALRRLGADEPIAETDRALAELDDRLGPLGLTALAAAPAEDKNVVVVTSSTAAHHRLESIGDLAEFAPRMRFGGPPECPDRPLCLIGLLEVYGLRFAEFAEQRSTGFTAEALRRGEIDVGLMFSTDPALASPDLEVLDDDRELQPAENVVPVIRSDALERWGSAVEDALDGLARLLTTDALQELNTRVDDRTAVARAASDWLTANGLLRNG